MNALKRLLGRVWRHVMHDSLRRNSVLLIASQGVTAATGLLFWIICARLFSAHDVGLATAFISCTALVATCTNLGLPNTIIRFLPTSKSRGGLFGAALLLVCLASLAGGFGALLAIRHIAPELALVQESLWLSGLFVVLVMGNAVSLLLDGTLMAFRKGQYILVKALLTNLPRLFIPFVVAGLALNGIVTAYAVMLIIGAAYTLVIIGCKLLRGQALRPKIKELAVQRQFALGNYLGGMFSILPSTLLPIIVLNALGATQTAYLFVPLQLALFLNFICSATAQALFSESSQQEDEAQQALHVRNAFKHMYRLLVPAMCLLILGGWFVLGLYGAAYAASGFGLLTLLSFSSLFSGVNAIGDAVLNIQKRSTTLIVLNVLNAAIIIVAALVTAPHGLLAVGIGRLAAQVVSASMYVILLGRAHVFGLLQRASSG